jgi:hypothetical protein
MPDGRDDFEEHDFRQPVADVDVLVELGQLRGAVDAIAEKLDQLDQSTRVLEDIDLLVNEARSRLGSIQLTVTALLVVAVFGIIAILGTLRNWF